MGGREVSSVKTKILVVDDERDLISTVEYRLKFSNCQVVTAVNGQEGLEKAAAEQPDLILLDTSMPVMDGWEATRRLRAEGYQRPIFALTAWSREEDKQRCLEAGCDAYFTKPLDRHGLIHAIKDYITGNAGKPTDA